VNQGVKLRSATRKGPIMGDNEKRSMDMTVKELIKALGNFDENHTVEIEAEYDCGLAKACGIIKDVQFKNGKCILTNADY